MVSAAAIQPVRRPVGIILAGGAGRRLGAADKALCSLGGEALLNHAIRVLSPQVDALAISANGDPARFDACGLPVIIDDLPGRLGPLAGLLAGLDWAARERPSAGWIITVPADAPFLPVDLVARLAVAAGTRGAVAASRGRLHPVVGLWPLGTAADLRRALVDDGLRRADAWVARQGAATVEWQADPVDPFFNINTPDDLAAAGRLLASRRSGRPG